MSDRWQAEILGESVREDRSPGRSELSRAALVLAVPESQTSGRPCPPRGGWHGAEAEILAETDSCHGFGPGSCQRVGPKSHPRAILLAHLPEAVCCDPLPLPWPDGYLGHSVLRANPSVVSLFQASLRSCGCGQWKNFLYPRLADSSIFALAQAWMASPPRTARRSRY